MKQRFSARGQTDGRLSDHRRLVGPKADFVLAIWGKGTGDQGQPHSCRATQILNRASLSFNFRVKER
jgi:hypothetical protein